MARYAVLVSEAFERDLDGATAYYLQTAGSASALGLLDDYDTMCGYLAEMPGYGARVHGHAYRWRPLKGFVAVYSVDEECGTVTLLRLFYMRSDWRKQLLD